MASALKRKRARLTSHLRQVPSSASERRYLVDEHGKRVAIVLDLEEYRRLVQANKTTLPAPAQEFDWIAEARRLRATMPMTSDSTPIIRAMREGTLR